MYAEAFSQADRKGDPAIVKAAIYTLTMQLAEPCWEHCQRRGYQVVAVILADLHGRAWGQVLSMVQAGEVDVIVINSWRDLPPERLPRVEVASEPDDFAERPRRIA